MSTVLKNQKIMPSTIPYNHAVSLDSQQIFKNQKIIPNIILHDLFLETVGKFTKQTKTRNNQ